MAKKLTINKPLKFIRGSDLKDEPLETVSSQENSRRRELREVEGKQ